MTDLSRAELAQKRHYDAMSTKYAAHYGDACSLRYRREFFNQPMLEGIHLAGAEVIDALCGSGETTGYLLERGANVTGIDISRKEMDRFESEFPKCKAHCSSILSTGLAGDSYDCVVMVGGLHHLHPDIARALDEIHRLLRPGGHFCFIEPHAGSAPDLLRRLWYSMDPLFEDNEAAIDLQGLKRENAERFEFVREEYGGNLGYLLVLNSLVFRIPLRAKPVYTPAFLRAEWLIQKLQGRRLSCFVIGQWRKI